MTANHSSSNINFSNLKSDYTKLDDTIVSLVLQQAIFKLTCNAYYPAILLYCLKRIEQNLGVRIIILDEKIIQSNSMQRNQNIEYSFNDNTVSNQSYFTCSLKDFEQACKLKNQFLFEDDDNRANDNDLNVEPSSSNTTYLTDIENALEELIYKGWLIQGKKSDQDMMLRYCVNLQQLQRDLNLIGFQLMLLLVNKEHQTNKVNEATKSTSADGGDNNQFQSRDSSG